MSITATYVQSVDRPARFTAYCPAWLDKLADDVTLEGSLMDGAVQGVEPFELFWPPSAGCMNTRSSTSTVPTATRASSRSTRLWFGASLSAVWLW